MRKHYERSGKLIHCHCYEPIGLSMDARQPWADVWIRFTAKPGRKVKRYGPTLVSMPSLLLDLECAIEADHKDDLECLNEIIAQLKTKTVVVGEDWEHGTPTIYTSNEYIDRKIAEQMLREMLWRLGIGWARFRWRRPRQTACPVG